MLKKFLMDENGQGMVEYGLILALIAVVVIVALTALGPKIKGIFNGVAHKIDAATPATNFDTTDITTP